MRRYEIQVREIDTFDDLVLFLIELRALAKGYDELKLDRPQWLVDKLREADLEFAVRSRAQKERRLMELKMRREQLATPDEKRGKIDAEIVSLEQELAATSAGG